MNEAETCRTLVRRKLRTAGWDGIQHFYSEQSAFTDGRISVPCGNAKRLKTKSSDFLLRFNRDITLAIVGAKSDKRLAGDGLQGPIYYANILGHKFAYAPKYAAPLPPRQVQETIAEIRSRTRCVREIPARTVRQLEGLLGSVLDEAFGRATP